MGQTFVPKSVTLVSTFTRDRVTLPSGECLEIPGGPAHYVGKALERLQLPYRLITGESVDVQVLPTADGQQYLIPAVSPIELPERLQDHAVILSPVMQEIDPEHIPQCDGLLVVDLQGFVREPMRPTDDDTGPYEV